MMASCCLHNWLMSDSAAGLVDSEGRNGDVRDGSWRQTVGSNECFQPVPRFTFCRCVVGEKALAERGRQVLCEWFNSAYGAALCPWQRSRALAGRLVVDNQLQSNAAADVDKEDS